MYTLNIYQNNELKKTFKDQKTDFKAFKFLLDNQSQSTSYAIKYGGWKVEIINQKTKEVSFY
jgi:hypothetical protein